MTLEELTTRLNTIPCFSPQHTEIIIQVPTFDKDGDLMTLECGIDKIVRDGYRSTVYINTTGH